MRGVSMKEMYRTPEMIVALWGATDVLCGSNENELTTDVLTTIDDLNIENI